MDEREKSVLRRRIDFVPAIFLQNDRISKFIRDMNHYNAKDIKKLERLITDLEGDLKYHILKKAADKISKLEALNKKIRELDIFENPEKYIDLLLKKKEELIMLAGFAGLLPDYVSGMPTHER
jgi:hypothetical protein